MVEMNQHFMIVLLWVLIFRTTPQDSWFKPLALGGMYGSIVFVGVDLITKLF